MNITSLSAAVAVHHPPEPPRAVEHPSPESSRPVLALGPTEAPAQQVRSEHGRTDRRDSEARAETGSPPDQEPRTSRPDALVGAILDVFA